MTITPNKWELDVQGYLNVCNITDDLAAAFDRGDIEGVAELSAEELAGLTPEPEGML